MQASSCSTKFIKMANSTFTKPLGGSNAKSSQNVVIGRGSSSNSILFAHGSESNCVFTRVRPNHIVLESTGADNISHKRASNHRYGPVGSVQHIGPLVNTRREFPGRTNTACATLTKSSGWTEHSNYWWVVDALRYICRRKFLWKLLVSCWGVDVPVDTSRYFPTIWDRNSFQQNFLISNVQKKQRRKVIDSFPLWRRHIWLLFW